MPREDVEALHRLADVNGDAVLDYAEFIAATLQERQLEEEENLLFAFKVRGGPCLSMGIARRGR